MNSTAPTSVPASSVNEPAATTTAAAVADVSVALSAIELADANVRDLDLEHAARLKASIKLRGLLTPLTVRRLGEGRYALVAGYHRHRACTDLGLEYVAVTIRDQDGTSADHAAENILRLNLSPLGEAHAVARMLADGFTPAGAATALGWSAQRVSARAKILKLPTAAHPLIDSGALPLRGVDVLLAIYETAPNLAVAVIAAIADQTIDGDDLARNPSWVLGRAAGRKNAGFAAYLNQLHPTEIEQLRLGKKTATALEQAEAAHRQLDRHAYGPPQVRFGEPEIDQARAAGVLLEFDRGNALIVDRELYRELAKQAVVRTRDELLARLAERRTEQAADRATGPGQRERTPAELLEADHRAAVREHTAQAHGVNLDLGAALAHELATVDPEDLDVAKFFAYGLLGPDSTHYLGTDDHTARTIAANGIRLVLDEHRATETPTLKSGQPGKTKVTYAEPDQASAWLWKFVAGAQTAGELYGRTMVVFAAQHYALQLVLPTSKRRGSALPRSHKDIARKAFIKATKHALPASHVQLVRAIEREARNHQRALDELSTTQRAAAAAGSDDIADVDLEQDLDEDLDVDELDEPAA
jgi:ParB/RepB/Spo0J family partition protein